MPRIHIQSQIRSEHKKARKHLWQALRKHLSSGSLYDGNEPNVIPVYDNSFKFQGYIAQAYARIFDPKYSHYVLSAMICFSIRESMLTT
jgi:hypothetical protein